MDDAFFVCFCFAFLFVSNGTAILLYRCGKDFFAEFTTRKLSSLPFSIEAFGFTSFLLFFVGGPHTPLSFLLFTSVEKRCIMLRYFLMFFAVVGYLCFF